MDRRDKRNHQHHLHVVVDLRLFRTAEYPVEGQGNATAERKIFPSAHAAKFAPPPAVAEHESQTSGHDQRDQPLGGVPTRSCIVGDHIDEPRRGPKQPSSRIGYRLARLDLMIIHPHHPQEGHGGQDAQNVRHVSLQKFALRTKEYSTETRICQDLAKNKTFLEKKSLYTAYSLAHHQGVRYDQSILNALYD